MTSRIHQKLGTAGFIIAIVALVAALCGGAYAAKGALTGKQKKQVTKIAQKEAKKIAKKEAKKFAGKAGAPGPAGANGINGKDGVNGNPGAPGAPGAAGKSVTVSEGAANCLEGGITVEVESSGTGHEVCNGEAGGPGPKGEPWTPDNTLPQGATETGAWALPLAQSLELQNVIISFPIPLASTLTKSHIHVEGEPNFADFDEGGSGTEGCAGSATEPTAPSGNLCVYKQIVLLTTLENQPEEVLPFGGVIFQAKKSNATVGGAVGSWAVTG